MKKIEEAAKKEKAKANKAAGIEPEAKVPKIAQKPAAKKEEATSFVRPKQIPGAEGKHVDQLELDLQNQMWIGGDEPA